MADPTQLIVPQVPAVSTEIEARKASAASNTAAAASPFSFADLLRVQQGIAPSQPLPANLQGSSIRFSAHAQTRLHSRQIALQPSHLERLHGAVQKAAGKGSRDALVLMDDMAMVVSVKNRTVVTVVDRENLKDNVFTNIDSAVIA